VSVVHPPRYAQRSRTLAFGVFLAALCVILPVLAQKPAKLDCVYPTVFPAALRPPKLSIGVYDPEGAFGSASNVGIEHVFIPWVDVELGSLGAADAYAAERGRKLLVTIEPWSWSQERNGPPRDLRDGILTGRYDDTISQVCTKLSTLKSPVAVRWGHEMDMKNGRYPWSDWRPQDYVSAYRHFVDICRRHAPKATYMWSPRGERNLRAFYPGYDYVDAIGLSVFGLQSYDSFALGSERDFTTLFRPGYDLARTFDKPIFISEFGCSGDAAYAKRCNDLSSGTLEQFPLLEGVVYYSSMETGDWPAAYGKPDWRVIPNRDECLDGGISD
jgi:beta-mannanase